MKGEDHEVSLKRVHEGKVGGVVFGGARAGFENEVAF